MGKRIDREMLVTAIRDMGMSDHETAELRGCSRIRVCEIRNELGLAFNKKKRPDGSDDTPEDIQMCLNCRKVKCEGNIESCRNLRRKAEREKRKGK